VSQGNERRADLELLRVVLCTAVILQHAVLIFAAEPRYHLKSAVPSAWASILYEFLRIFAMPPFFTIAGWAAVQSLRRRSPARFLRERLVRLVVPLIAGILLLGPIIKFIELGQGRDLSLSGFRLVPPLTMPFLAFLPRYYTRIALVTWSHLWFLAYLALISVALLPLLVHLARRAPAAFVPGAALIYLPAVPLALVLTLFHGYWPYLPNLLTDWTNFAYFALCFATGAVIGAWPGFEVRLQAEVPRLAVLGMIAFVGVTMVGESTAGRALVGVTAWCCIGAAWGAMRRLRPARSAVLVRLSEATLPVYVIHHVPLLLLGLVLLPLQLSVASTIGFIAIGDIIMSLAFYWWVILPSKTLRFLTGCGQTMLISR
jgi:fucose 4-O-acetylase-like acetyltransferase